MNHPPPYLIATIGRGKLYAMAMPSAEKLTDEIRALGRVDINSVVSLQQKTESSSLGLSAEEKTCTAHGISFTRFAIEDYGVPEEKSLTPFIDSLYSRIRNGEHTLVHCKGGIGRTGLICCCLLIKSGLSADAAIALVSNKRQHPVPETPSQFAMVSKFGMER